MLILTRKANETIQIGDDIELKVLRIDGDQVKLGVDAPKHIDIHRKEIYMAIQEENNQAANASPNLLTQLNKQINKNS